MTYIFENENKMFCKKVRSKGMQYLRNLGVLLLLLMLLLLLLKRACLFLN